MSLPVRRRSLAAPVVVLAVALAAVNLRPGATSVGPVLAEMRGGLGMSAAQAGILTSLPPLCFGLVGALAVALARRLGTTAGITLGLVAAAAGLLLRVTSHSTWTFLVLTVLALGGMALGNVLVPGWVKHHAHRTEIITMTLYGTGLIVGGAVGPLASAPLADALGGWRPALGAWGLLVVLALPLWMWLTVVERRDLADRDAPVVAPSGRIATSPTALALTALFGLQSMHAYIQFGWLPQIYRDAGLSATGSGALVAIISGTGIVGGLTVPTLVARARSLTPYVLGFGTLLAGGYAGLLFSASTLPWLWAAMLGIAGFAFPLSIALLTARTRSPVVTAQLSGFVQSVGYLIAALGPFTVGLIHQITGTWTLVLWLLLASSVPFTWAAVRVSRSGYVDDELN